MDSLAAEQYGKAQIAFSHVGTDCHLTALPPPHMFKAVLARHQPTTIAQQEVAKKRTRRAVKHQRAVVGASLDVIKERRAQRPEARKAARDAAIKEGKEKRAAAESEKKANKAKNATKGQTQRIQSKQGAKGAPQKVKATTR